MRGETDGFGNVLLLHLVPAQPEDLLIRFGQGIPERFCFDAIPNGFLQFAVRVKAEIRLGIVLELQHLCGNLRRMRRVRMIPTHIEIGLIMALP